jgi:hypothetical protein
MLKGDAPLGDEPPREPFGGAEHGGNLGDG